MIRTAAVVALAAALGACMTPAQRAAQQTAILDGYKAACSSYGYPSGTPAHADCVANLARADAARPAPVYQIGGKTIPRGAQCTSQRVGDTVQTNCF